MKQNTQPIETRVIDPDGTLEVHSTFYTIQGEGPFAGRPAVFIRLAGCNLQCPGCDTEYTSQRKLKTPAEIYEDICWLLPQNFQVEPIVVITGGEPFRQNLEPLILKLADNNLTVQIETNGGLEIPLEVAMRATVVCSPKTSLINRRNLNRIDALKYVLHADSVCSEDGLPLTALDHSNSGKVFRPDFNNWDFEQKPIYVQPMDSHNTVQNERNQQAAVDSCLKFGYTLQLQIHKIIGVE